MSHIARRSFLAVLASAPFIPFAASATNHADHEVIIEGFKYSPDTLSAKAGDIVRFINKDRAPHTATANAGGFDTGTLKRNQMVEVEIPAGDHAYFCKFHPRMKAQITAT